MKTNEFFFELPERLIAQYPSSERGQSRLMTLDRKTGLKTHGNIMQLPDILSGPSFLSPSGEKPLLVFNNTRVRKARLTGISVETGSQAEFLLLEKMINEKAEIGTEVWKTIAKRSSRRKVGSRYVFNNTDGAEIAKAQITKADGDFRFLEFDRPIEDGFLDEHGAIPLPPYIKRKDTALDEERYQTVYAKQTGSAASPTAGLHFTVELLDRIKAAGLDIVFVTLHVGLGTFLPVRSENIEDHNMHSEMFYIDEQTALSIEKAKAQGRKIIAVGTTSVRTLESAWVDGKLKQTEGNTSIFIYPGYNFKVVDAVFTNFHTPESTLLMLVSAFAGRELILKSYAEAVREEYRFFSYGDAMLIY